MGGSYDVILVLHPFRDNVREFQVLARPLEVLDAEYLLGTEGLFNPKTDTALIVLRFSEEAAKRFGPYTIHLFAGRSGLPMIVPAKLSPLERRKFFLEHLTASYSVYVQLYPCADEPGSLVERTLGTLSGHIEMLPYIEPPRDFDIEHSMPLFNPHLQRVKKRRKPRRTQPPWRRLDSVG